MFEIKPQDVTRTDFDKIAKTVASEHTDMKYLQDLHALAIRRALSEIVGLELPDPSEGDDSRDQNRLLMEVLKIAGNASAQRQRLEGKKEKTDIVDSYSNIC